MPSKKLTVNKKIQKTLLALSPLSIADLHSATHLKEKSIEAALVRMFKSGGVTSGMSEDSGVMEYALTQQGFKQCTAPGYFPEAA